MTLRANENRIKGTKNNGFYAPNNRISFEKEVKIKQRHSFRQNFSANQLLFRRHLQHFYKIYAYASNNVNLTLWNTKDRNFAFHCEKEFKILDLPEVQQKYCKITIEGPV